MSGFRPLSRKLATLVVATIVVVVAMAHVFSSRLFDTMTKESHDATVAMIVRLVEQGVRIQDNAQKLLEERMADKMKKAMGLLHESYENNPGNPRGMDLEGVIASAGGGMDLFVVDLSHTVVHTNFAKDLGLVIGEGDFALFLDGVLASGEYVLDRPILSFNDGIKQFAYQATKDRKFILEVGAPFRPSEGFHDILAFQNLARNIVGNASYVKSLEIFAQHHSTNFLNVNDTSSLLPPGARLAAATQAVQQGQQQMAAEDGRHFHYIPIAVDAGQPAKRVVELEMDDSNWAALRLRHVQMQVLVYAMLVLVGIAFSLWVAREVVRPISQLSTSVRKIAAGDLGTEVVAASNDEVGLLSQDINAMRKSIAELLEKLETANENLAFSYDVTIRAFLNALKFNESSTAEHSLRVNKVAMAIGRQMGLNQDQLTQLEWGSLLHDIGKLAIPNSILRKTGPLTQEELAIVRTHPAIAHEMLKEATFLEDALLVSLHHQEQFDGMGYPHGLAGTDIPLLARICTVADAYEAMTADRAYRRGRCHEEAVTELTRLSGTQFDPDIVAVFLSISRAEYS
ncbi:MAG: HD domain-containing protein [Desulfovibrio sp.]|nr:HD domain-containing protein [Desulfovibrio sp.]MBI4961376.1 HD domain-containing protein [Desulfovibrio sp.]